MTSEDFTTVTPTELLGPLNEVEAKFAPSLLYVSGDTSLARYSPRISIVGSRNATREGALRAKKLARLVCENGGVVVSGLAKGIDSAAHTAAIECSGRTIAVIGTPLNRAYPAENRELQQLIMREHLCVSQFPIGYPTQPKNFPIRNRTMALISDATVIVEASEKSGSISQGWEALRLGRGLFLSKSLASNPNLRWPNELRAYGAQILADDNLEEFFDSLPRGYLGFAASELSF